MMARQYRGVVWLNCAGSGSLGLVPVVAFALGSEPVIVVGSVCDERQVLVFWRHHDDPALSPLIHGMGPSKQRVPRESIADSMSSLEPIDVVDIANHEKVPGRVSLDLFDGRSGQVFCNHQADFFLSDRCLLHS